jgi:hypothetical protein
MFAIVTITVGWSVIFLSYLYIIKRSKISTAEHQNCLIIIELIIGTVSDNMAFKKGLFVFLSKLCFF